MHIDEFTDTVAGENPEQNQNAIQAISDQNIVSCQKCGYRWPYWRPFPGVGDYECYDCHPPVQSNDSVTASPTVREWALPIVAGDGKLIEWEFGS